MLKFLRVFLITALSFLALASIVGLVLYKTEGLRFYSVQTNSMAPIIQPGDLLISTKIASDKLQVGDIVSYISPQAPHAIITHRIVVLNPAKGYLITKGDNVQSADPTASISSVVGRATKTLPKAGKFLDFIHRPAGLIIAVYLPALIICSVELSRTGIYYRRQSYGLQTGL